MLAIQAPPHTHVTCDELLAVSATGDWEICLPAALSEYKLELEELLNKVFRNSPCKSDNLNLARQLAINWCVSKCKETGLSDKCLQGLV